MEPFKPSFRRDLKGCLVLTDSIDAKMIKREERKHEATRSPAIVRKEAVELVKRLGGDVSSARHLLGSFTIEFGCFRGMTFKWILENSPGYAGYLVIGMERDEAKPKDYRWINKMAFKRYIDLWPEAKELVELKRKSMPKPSLHVIKANKGASATPTTSASSTTVTSASATRGASSATVSRASATSSTSSATVSRASATTSASSATVSRASATTSEFTTTTTEEMSDNELLSATQKMEDNFSLGKHPTRDIQALSSRDLFVPTVSAQRKALLSTDQVGSPQTLPPTSYVRTTPVITPSTDVTSGTVTSITRERSQQEARDLCLPARWKKTLPKVDQVWVSKALFRWTGTGGVELVPDHLSKLWWHPPQPAVAVNSIPGMDRYFARPLFLWMPRKQWKVKLYCPHPGCEGKELASAGINQKVRQVVDIEGYYNLACDNLECMKCRRRILSWSHAILSQLDIGHRVQFPCILTARLACDMKVVRLLRNRGLGNSCSQVQKKLEEQHGEKWLQCVLHYLTDCSVFSRAAASSLLVHHAFAEPPERVPLPSRRWLMNIFIQDVLHRLDETKASITSVFGRILKMDSTKKVVKKLAGRPAKTALWCTNIGNEHGQILTSVMTSGEGHGLTPMLVGVINRFSSAHVPSPEIIYVDRDCCGPSPLKQVLTASAWETEIRLDIWHFMRRIATGCTTDSHQLYSSFMGLLSNCIFHWDEQDIGCLIKSKRNELAAQHLFVKNDADVMKHLSRYELSLHCRRTTRGEADTTKLISDMLEKFSGDQGRNTLGVPLINTSRMKTIWDAQRKHIPCIQDPPGVSLYTRTGTTKRGGFELPNYRCARGSTSLESFHLHLNRFIPGTLARDVLFQAYIVDGLHRWNEDRAQQATTITTEKQCYSDILRHSANVLGVEVLGRKVVQTYQEPRKYTGELIGIEYLYSQTGTVLEDSIKAIENLEYTEEEMITADDDDEELQDTDPIDDLTVSTAGLMESSDLVIADPSEPSVSSPPSTTQTIPPILSIPTSEEYESMMRDTNVSQATPPPIENPIPIVQEEGAFSGETGATNSESEYDESVDPDNIPGYGKVQELAAYLISVRQDIYLTNIQVTHLIKLWNDLPDYDKRPTVFPERFSREARGRFKAKKSVRNVVPGVESTERSIRGGPGAVPASWPNANRYTEAIFLQLLSSFPRRRTRFDDVTKAYYNIRQLVLLNGKVMKETRIQLPEISRGTLIQWNTKRGKDMDKLVVMQGVRFDEPTKTTSEGVPVALEKPSQLSSGIREEHIFTCPENTAGMARFKGRKVSSAQSTLAQQVFQPISPMPVNSFSSQRSSSTLTDSTNIITLSQSASPIAAVEFTATKLTDSQPILPLSTPIISPLIPSSLNISFVPSCQPTPAVRAPQSASSSEPTAPLQTVNFDGQPYMLTTTSSAVPSNVPYTTQRYRKRKLELEKEGIVRRKYERKQVPRCKKCGQERLPPSHAQYFMNWFCEVTSPIPFIEWKEELEKKGYGRRKNQK